MFVGLVKPPGELSVWEERRPMSGPHCLKLRWGPGFSRGGTSLGPGSRTLAGTHPPNSLPAMFPNGGC